MNEIKVKIFGNYLIRMIMAEGGDSVDSGRKQGGFLRGKIPDISSLYLGSEEVQPVLCRDHGQEFKYFCKGHMTELCITCRRMEHKNCKTVIDIEQAAATIYSDDHGEKIIQSVKYLIDRFQDCKVAAENLKSLFPDKIESAVDKVRKARKDIDNYLDELEDRAVDEIDRNIKKDIQTKEEQIHVCEASLSFLKTSDSDIDRTLSVGNKEEKFIAINRATKQTTQYCNMLLEMSREMSELNVTFEPNVALPDIFQSLGTVSVETSKVTDVFIDTTSIYTGEMKVKKNVSDKPPVVTSLDVLQDGRKLVLDRNNAKIQLYDKNNTFLTETVLPVKEDEKCTSVILNSSTEALVSTGYGKLFKVRISDELTVSEIKTNFKIFSMTKYGEDVLCVDIQRQLCVIDKNMEKIIKTILKDDGTLFRGPGFLGVSADKNTIYVLDQYKGCYGIALDGQIVFHYQNSEAVGYGGLVVDSDGMFICYRVGSEFHVEKLNFSGERQEVCTIFGNSRPLKIVENELVVFQFDDRNIRFYCLLK